MVTEYEYRLAEKTIKEIYKTLYKDTEQYVFTPFDLCEKMINKVDSLSNEFIFVVNPEFAYILTKRFNIDPNKIIAFSDNSFKEVLYKELGIFHIIHRNFMFEEHIFIYDDMKELELKEVKFSAIFGNPAYNKDFHLKMLKKSMEYLSENGTCVWLHPARWAQDPLGPYKQGTDFKKYKDLPWTNFEIIARDKANKSFNINNDSDLIISILKNGKKSILDKPLLNKFEASIISKILTNSEAVINDFVEKESIKGFRVPIKAIIPIASSGGRNYEYNFFVYRVCDNFYANNGYVDKEDKHWTDMLRKNQHSRSVGDPMPLSIKFKSAIEAENFIDSTNTNIYKYIRISMKKDPHTPLRFLPYLKDYSKKWTDKDLINYFDFTNEEVDYIFNKLEKYS